MSAPAPVFDSVRWARAHAVPFFIFIGLLLVLQVFATLWGWDHPLAPWWRRAPEQWLYPLQTVICFGLLIVYRRSYRFDWSLRWSLVAIVFGTVGISAWLLPNWWYEQQGYSGEAGSLLHFLGVRARREGFDPADLNHPSAEALAIGFRFFRAVVVVALVEEIFWRGFLMRFVQDWEGPYWRQPFGRHTWLAFAVVTGGFILAHAPSDYAAAAIYGSLTYLLCVWSKSLGACVVMHGVANLLMCLYIVQTGNYGLW